MMTGSGIPLSPSNLNLAMVLCFGIAVVGFLCWMVFREPRDTKRGKCVYCGCPESEHSGGFCARFVR